MIFRLFKLLLWLVIIVLMYVVAQQVASFDQRMAACLPSGTQVGAGPLEQLSRLQEELARLQGLLNTPVDSFDVMVDKAAAGRDTHVPIERVHLPVSDPKALEAEVVRLQGCISRLQR